MENPLVYLVHHAETPLDEAGKFAGVSQTGLSRQGIKTATRTARYFAMRPKLGASGIYSSPQPRALETARIIHAAVKGEDGYGDIPIRQDAGLGAPDLGGLTFQKENRQNRQALSSYLNEKRDEPIEGGETGGNWLKRFSASLIGHISAARAQGVPRILSTHSINIAAAPHILSGGKGRIATGGPRPGSVSVVFEKSGKIGMRQLL